jgi:hypothetical protein
MYTDEFRTQWPWPKKKVGAAVPILYDSDNPQDAHISSLRQLWGRVIGVLFVGSGCVIASMILVIVW